MPVTIMILAVGLIILISGSWKTWTGDRAEQTTDDAYVRADLTPLSTKIAALVASVEVADYQAVKAGDVLVRLRDEVFALRLSRPKPLWRRVKPLW
jgi:membrane fusion protein (multidrug efflux system)